MCSSDLACLAQIFVCTTIALGAAAVLTGKAVTPTTAHVATGAAVLGSCWWIALRARRLLRAPVPAKAPALGVREPLAS